MAAVTPAIRETRFDGVWLGDPTRPSVRDGTAVKRPQRVLVRNGQMVLDLAARPCSLQLSRAPDAGRRPY